MSSSHHQGEVSLFKNLQEVLGLTQNEAKVYQALLTGSSTDAQELASLTKLPRTRVYAVLSTLAARNLVDKRTNNGGYRLIPPNESIPHLISAIQEEHREHVATVQELGQFLHNVWKDGITTAVSPGVQIFAMEDIEPMFIDQIKKVRSRVWIAAADAQPSLNMQKSGQSLAAAYQQKQKLDIKYLISLDAIAERMKQALTRFPPFQKMKIEFCVNKELYSSFVILDDVIYIFFFGADEKLGRIVMMTSSKQLLKTFEWTFLTLWEQGNLL